MWEPVFMVGLGGQGVVLAGQLLAQAAMDAGFQVSWYPLYSPEVRGGEATCTVVLSDGRVGSPVAGRPLVSLMFDAAGCARFLPKLVPGGLAIVNIDLATEPLDRDDIEVIRVPANRLAIETGSEKAINMVMLGAFIGARHPELMEPFIAALTSILPERHHRFLPGNIAALRAGAACA